MNSVQSRNDLLVAFEATPDDVAVGVPMAAAVLGVSVRSIWRMVDDGKLRRVDLGVRACKFRAGAIRDLLRPKRRPA